MSPSTTARDNWVIAAEAFKHFVETNEIPSVNPKNNQLWMGGVTSANKKKQLNLLNNIVNGMGKDNAVEWMYSDHTIAEINRIRKDYADLGKIDGKQNDKVLGLFAFGPKVGPFVSNLNGIHDVTVDKWMTRTFKRYIGNMIDKSGNIIDLPTPQERAVIKKLINEVAKNEGIKSYQAQSILWFYEQRLFRSLGTPSPSYGFSDGARKFLEQDTSRRERSDQQNGERGVGVNQKNKYSLALGNIDPTTFLVSEKNPNNTGNLAFMPGAAPFAKYPIRLPVGTHDDISDKGYGANHILRRMQTDVKRRPAEVTKERLEDLILHIENLGKRFKRVYRSGLQLVLYDPLTDDAMFVRQLADHYEVQSMYSDARIPTKYGNAAWSGKNIQPPEAKKFEEKQRGILVQASKEGRVEPKPVGVRVKRVLNPNQIEAEADREPTKGTLSLKKKMSLRVPQNLVDLVKKMEELVIVRPSTYAPTI
jgi:hypothetical protein